MSDDAPRINPRRASTTGASGLKRIELRKLNASAAVADTAPKPLRSTQSVKRWHMAVAYAERGSLDEPARQALAAAAILAAPDTGVIAIILGECSEDLGAMGADQVVVFSHLNASQFEPERHLFAVLSLIKNYLPAHIFMPDNARGEASLGRRLASSLRCTIAARVMEVSTSGVAVASGQEGCLARAPLPQIILMEPGIADTDLPFTGLGKRLDSAVLPDVSTIATACRDLGLEASDASNIALEEADFVVSAGHGVHNIATLEKLAGTLGATVGASRVAVDEGKFPRDRQIGASGKTVSANAYIAVGISGAVQHLQGIKDCRHVIAINTDPAAPITKRANLTIAGDAEDIMQALITRIAQAKAQRESAEGEP